MSKKEFILKAPSNFDRIRIWPILWAKSAFGSLLWGILAWRRKLSARASPMRWARARERFFSSVVVIPPPPRDTFRLASLSGKYDGERCFVIGNGPSLNQMNLDLLEGEYTFATNRFYLMYNRLAWRPSFYTTLDWRVVPDNFLEINELRTSVFFFPERFRGMLREGEDVFWYEHFGAPPSLDSEKKFSRDATLGVRGAGSVTGTAIQLATFLGFRELYLIGCDLSYAVTPSVIQGGPDRFGNGVGINLTSTADDDPNHFSPAYFGKGKKWHDPNVKRMLSGYEQCRDGAKQSGILIANAGVGGSLEVFPRVDYLGILGA